MIFCEVQGYYSLLDPPKRIVCPDRQIVYSYKDYCQNQEKLAS